MILLFFNFIILFENFFVKLVLWVIMMMSLFLEIFFSRFIMFLDVLLFNVLVGLFVRIIVGLLISVFVIEICCCWLLDNWLGFLLIWFFNLILVKILSVFFFLIFFEILDNVWVNLILDNIFKYVIKL